MLLLLQTVSEAGHMAMLCLRCNILTTQVASYPSLGWKWEHRVVFAMNLCIHFHSLVGTQEALDNSKVPHV